MFLTREAMMVMVPNGVASHNGMLVAMDVYWKNEKNRNGVGVGIQWKVEVEYKKCCKVLT